MGKVLGFPEEALSRFSDLASRGDFRESPELEKRMAQAGLDKTTVVQPEPPNDLTAAQPVED